MNPSHLPSPALSAPPENSFLLWLRKFLAIKLGAVPLWTVVAGFVLLLTFGLGGWWFVATHMVQSGSEQVAVSSSAKKPTASTKSPAANTATPDDTAKKDDKPAGDQSQPSENNTGTSQTGSSSAPGSGADTSDGGSSGGASGGESGGSSSGPATCPGYPSFPTPSCTGWEHTGVSLSVVTGIYYADVDGQVLDSKDFIDGVVVRANNVTIKRSRVYGRGSGPGAGIWVNQGISGTLIEDVEVTSKPGYNPNDEDTIVDRAITGFHTNGLTMRRVYAHHIIRGLQYGCNTLIEDSYVDNEVNPTDAHMSAIGGSTCDTFSLTVRHNHVGLTPNVNDSAALLFYPPQVGAYGTQNINITIEKNYVIGGTYCIWASSDPQFVGTARIIDNHFGTDYYSSCGLYGTHFKDNWGSEGSATMTWANNTKNGVAVGF